MVRARFVKKRIRERNAYQFFGGLDAGGAANWMNDIAARKPVFEHKGMCYRGGVTYSSGLERYLWGQIHPDSPHKQEPLFPRHSISNVF